jgi:hypothetical protein
VIYVNISGASRIVLYRVRLGPRLVRSSLRLNINEGRGSAVAARHAPRMHGFKDEHRRSGNTKTRERYLIAAYARIYSDGQKLSDELSSFRDLECTYMKTRCLIPKDPRYIAVDT